MKLFPRRKLLVVLTALAVVGGAGGALAATRAAHSSGRQAYIQDVAKRLGVKPAALTAAMKASAIDRINAAVAAGRLTRAQGNAFKQRIEHGKGIVFLGRHAFPGRHLGERKRMGLAAASSYLGISRATLRNDLRSGNSLAQVASSIPSKSPAGLKAALLAAAKTKLDQAVSHGRITSRQEQQVLGRLASVIDHVLSRTWTR